MNRPEPCRGIALVLVSALLALLALVVVGISATAASGRRVAGGQVQSARAALLARSGLERATQAVTRHPVPRSGRDPALDWTFRDPVGTRLEAASNPSLHDPQMEPWLDDGDGTWEGEGYTDRNGNGRYDGASGRLRGALWTHGDTYTLRIEDESAKINVNGGFLDDQDRDNDTIPDHRDPDVRMDPADPFDTGRGWNFQLARILDTLGTRLVPPQADLGRRVVEGRPTGGYGSVEEMALALGVVGDLSPYLTVSSWVDRKIVHPNGTSRGVLFERPDATNDLKKARCDLRIEEGGRPPVNLNLAPPEVLYSLVCDLTAYGWNWKSQTHPGGLYVWETYFSRRPAQEVVDLLIARRAVDPFETWREFGDFCDSLSSGTGNVLWPHSQDVLKANFDPNTASNKELPDQLMWHRVDKTDLVVWSTDGCLEPTGVFRVRSLGRVSDRRGGVQASSGRDTTAEIFRPLRQTTQRDFVAGRLPDGTADGCLSPASAPWRTTGASASWNTWSPGRGLAVVTHPNPPTALPAAASDLDGSVSLATLEHDGLPFEPACPLLFLHRFDDSWDAEDVGNPDPLAVIPLGSPYGALLQDDLTTDVWPGGSIEPNTLGPDGARPQALRSVTFQASAVLPPYEGIPAGTPPGNRAVISAWVKPLMDREYDGTAWYGPHVPNLWLMMTRSDRLPPQPLTQVLILAMEGDAWVTILERSMGDRSSDLGAGEEMVQVPVSPASESRMPGLRWHLVTTAIDTNETEMGKGTWLRVGASPRVSATPLTWLPTWVPPSVPEDFRDGGELTLGPRGLDWRASVCPPPVSNCVLDEVCIQDFGDDPVLAQDRAARFHAQRLQDGRYYKGDDGTFVSAVQEPDGGTPARLLRAVWTAYVPSETRREIHDTRDTTYVLSRFGRDRLLDPALARSRVEFELLDDASQTVLQSLSHGAPLGIARARFRYRARFVNGLTELGLDPLNQPVMESPWLDDITFFVQPASGARALSWRES